MLCCYWMDTSNPVVSQKGRRCHLPCGHAQGSYPFSCADRMRLTIPYDFIQFPPQSFDIQRAPFSRLFGESVCRETEKRHGVGQAAPLIVERL